MDKPVLIIEMPELSDESVVVIRDFLESLLSAFDAYYFNQLRQYYYPSSFLDDEVEF